MKKVLSIIAMTIITGFMLISVDVQCEEELQKQTYIDVDIANQTLTYVEDGNVILSSPVVTGGPGNSTPKGVFAINYTKDGKYLNGPTWHVWVDRWMRFSGNCGLHDATWRKDFGGEIYKTNGSHGCVNLPHDVALQLYDMVSVGTTVVVH